MTESLILRQMFRFYNLNKMKLPGAILHDIKIPIRFVPATG